MIRWHYGRKLPVANTFDKVHLLAIIEKEMGYSRLAFLNQFKCFAKEINYTLADNTITLPLNSHSNNCSNKCSNNGQNYINSDEANLSISFCEQSDRSIGSLNIPRLAVKFIFRNYTEGQQMEFLKRFDLSFQRGGG